ncbi:hypothetical protein AGMMS49975_28410 [Clostridia bacterium]|nr:hypothetical protein AGMMS49975_28410 [Clostridia bacterium]
MFLLKRLKELRIQGGYTQKSISELLKCNIRQYQKIEYGELGVPLPKLIILADCFGVSLDYLVGRSSNPAILDRTVSD